jgi:hypothetical protein
MKTIIAMSTVLILGGSDGISFSRSVDNPANLEFVQEIAFNEGIDDVEVTQQMFNNRYLRK